VISGHLEEWASVPSFLPISWGPKPEPVQWLVAGDILPAEMALEEGPGPLRTPILEPHLRVELRASQPWSEAAEMAVRRELFR